MGPVRVLDEIEEALATGSHDRPKTKRFSSTILSKT